jgi:hypothetical protein
MNKKIHNIYIRTWWFVLCLYFLVFLLFSVPLFAEEKKENRYIGSDSCKPCHATQYDSFKSHARKKVLLKMKSKDAMSAILWDTGNLAVLLVLKRRLSFKIQGAKPATAPAIFISKQKIHLKLSAT